MLKKSNFFMTPNKIFELELDAYEIAVYVFLNRFNPSFPGYRYLKKKLNISRDRLWKSLQTLHKCNVITWVKTTGKSNFYVMMPEGVWVKKIVDKSDLPIRKPVRQTDYTRTPDGLLPVRQTDSNNTNLNKRNLIKAPGFLKIVDNLKLINKNNEERG